MNGPNGKARRIFLPGLKDILFISIFLAVLLSGPIMLNIDGDLPRHLLTGKLILETRMVPGTEPFAYPYQGKPFVSHAHDWLSDSLFYLTYTLAGLPGVAILSALVLAATFTILYTHTTKQTSVRLLPLFLILWGAAVTSLNWVTRPFLFSMLFLAVWLTWLDKLARNERISLWYFPALILVWSNMHGEFIAAFLALLAYAAGWLWDYLFGENPPEPGVGKNLLIVTGISFLASLINPAGFNPWKTMFGFVNNAYLMSRMYEARPPDFSQPEFMVLLALISFSIFILAVNQQKISTSKAFLLAGFSAMSLMAGRNAHLYGIVAPFVLAEAVNWVNKVRILARLENSVSQIETNTIGLLWPLGATAASILFLYMTPLQTIFEFDPRTFPVQATGWIAEHPQSGNMFNELNWGGYLALHLWPEHAVFADSMADTTGELTREYEKVITLSPEWEEILAKYQVNWVVLPASSRLAERLERAGWMNLYQDDTAIIIRNSAPP